MSAEEYSKRHPVLFELADFRKNGKYYDARCKACNKVYKKHNTAHLYKHLLEKCPQKHTRVGLLAELRQQIDNARVGHDATFNVDTLYSMIAILVAVNSIPLSLVAYDEFKHLMRYANSRYKNISRARFTNHIIAEEALRRNKITMTGLVV